MNSPHPIYSTPHPYPHPIIAREGWPFIAIALFAALIASIAGFWSLPFWLLFIFCAQFFRDPPRFIAGNANSVISAADGRVVAVEETDDPYLNRRALKISVFMNVFNVHSNRSPLDAKVIQRWYNPGHFFNAALEKASLQNERCALHLQTPAGHDVVCVQIAGLIARRILNYVDAGDALDRGQRYGFIRFGSRVDIYLPLNTEVKVAIGETVYAASTVLAELTSSTNV